MLITTSTWINTVIQTVRLVSENMAVVEVYDAVSIPRSTFNYTLQHDPEAFEEYKGIERVKLFEQLVVTINAFRQVLDTVIQDAISAKTKLRERVAIMKFLDEQLDKLREQIVKSEQTKEANTVVLSDPRQVRAKSRLSASQGTREGSHSKDDSSS